MSQIMYIYKISTLFDFIFIQLVYEACRANINTISTRWIYICSIYLMHFNIKIFNILRCSRKYSPLCFSLIDDAVYLYIHCNIAQYIKVYAQSLLFYDLNKNNL